MKLLIYGKRKGRHRIVNHLKDNGKTFLESIEAGLIYLLNHSYIGMFGLLIACSFIFPFSKTVLLLAGGVLASRGIGELYIYMLIGMAGLVTADTIYFYLGGLGGEKVVHWRLFKRLKRLKGFNEAEAYFKQYELLAVFGARFVPVFRNVVYFSAGLSKMPIVRFLTADFLSALLLVLTVSLVGYFMAEKYQLLARWLDEGKYIFGLLICLMFFLYFLYRRRQHR